MLYYDHQLVSIHRQIFLFKSLISSEAPVRLLSESISGWLKDIYKTFLILKFPMKLNTENGSTVSLHNHPKYWTTVGAIKVLVSALFQERILFWKIMSICKIEVIEKLPEEGCSSQLVRQDFEASLFNSLESQNNNYTTK